MCNKDKLKKLLSKYRLDIGYGDTDMNCEFSFSRNDGFWSDEYVDETTQVRMSEEMAAPILAVIEDVIPDAYDYYYENLPVRKAEAKLIYQRMQEVRIKVFENPSDPSLGKIAERLRYSEFAWDYHDNDSKERILFKRRHELAALYKLFMLWLGNGENLFFDFVVTGP